jgi:hypothetical protein
LRYFVWIVLFLSTAVWAQQRDSLVFTNYDLAAEISPAEQSFAVRGKVTVFNLSRAPQESVFLQISSSLRWATVRAAGKTLPFTQSTVRSDVDHTGSVNEAEVKLSQPLQPNESIELEVGYRGQVLLSTQRLEQLGTPAAVAAHTDYDRITANFTLLRGVGHVLWFPAAIDPATLDQGNKVFTAMGEWKARHASSHMKLNIAVLGPEQAIITNADAAEARERSQDPAASRQTVVWNRFSLAGPLIVLGNYAATGTKVAIQYLPEHHGEANDYAAATQNFEPPLTGSQKRTPVLVDLPSRDDQVFDAGSIFLVPLKTIDRPSFELMMAYLWAHATIPSVRPWIAEGAAHYAQALMRERQEGRKAAIQFMNQKRSGLAIAEPDFSGTDSAGQNAGQSLINATDEIYYRTKAMFVWWMLRDLLGEATIRNALERYKPEDDKSAAYMQKLLESEPHKELEWFFDNWVYRDRGLPEFKISNVYVRESMRSAFLVTATVENTGAVTAETPIVVTTSAGDVNSRLQVPARSKAVARIEVGSRPVSVQVNDGSVPETDLSDNTAAAVVASPQ